MLADPTTAEPEPESTAAVEELATACSRGPSTQAAAEGATTSADAEPAVIPSAPSSAASSAFAAEDAEISGGRADGTFNPGTNPSSAPRTSTPGTAQAAAAEAGTAGDVRGKSWCYTWLQHAPEQEAVQEAVSTAPTAKERPAARLPMSLLLTPALLLLLPARLGAQAPALARGYQPALR